MRTYKSVFVGDVVGELQFVERDRLAHPLLAGRRGVRMDVHALRHLRVGLSSDHPARVVELVAAVVDGNDVHQHDVLGSLVQSRHFHFERRKHPPVHPNKFTRQLATSEKIPDMQRSPTAELDRSILHGQF